VATQRDYGDRFNRRHARMKYLVEDWGVDRFRQEVERYFGKSIQPFKPLPEFKYLDFLGWHEQGDGNLFLGISIENGRIKDEGSFKLKSALREIEERFALPIRLTANHNLVLYEIEPSQQVEIQEILQRCGIRPETEIDPLVRYSMACPALPTCGLATAESERALPGIMERIRALLDKVGLDQEHFVVRMTGCPNGCARPYLAELGFVGQSPDTYQLWLGADPHQTRLAELYLDKLNIQNLEAALEPLLVYFKQEQQHQVEPESFGNFCHRVGFDALRQFATSYQPGTSGKARYRIGIRNDVYTKLKAIATEQGKPMTEIANTAIEAYLKTLS
jgi:sulfite reductase (ferredoxin)